MLGKIIDGTLVVPSKNEREKLVISNPTKEQLKFIMGYKDLIIDKEPEVVETQNLVAFYEETDDSILQHWKIEDLEKNEIYFDNNTETEMLTVELEELEELEE